LIESRTGEEVRAALETLPEEQRELVRLAFYSGWSHAKLAAQTNLPLGTVKSRLRLAFNRLRDKLDGRI
jgi:RNA polymerase sigma-70 factor (ECF subfamily)